MTGTLFLSPAIFVSAVPLDHKILLGLRSIGFIFSPCALLKRFAV